MGTDPVTLFSNKSIRGGGKHGKHTRLFCSPPTSLSPEEKRLQGDQGECSDWGSLRGTGSVLVLSGHKGSELAGTEQQLGLPLSNQCVPPAATESWMATLALGGEAARREGVCLTGRFVSLPSPQLFLLCGPWGGRGEGRSGGICSC